MVSNRPTTEVALSAPTRDVDPLTWQMVREQSELLYLSSFVNKEQVKSKHDALLIVLKGRELGVPPTQALQNIVVVKGKATANAELMLALIYRDHGDDAVWFDTSTEQECVISYKRRSWPQRKTYRFSMEDAERAGLGKRSTYKPHEPTMWEKFPANMLRARCISAVARMAFPDTIGGMYTYDELGVPTTVNEDGQVVLQGEIVSEAPAAALDEARTLYPAIEAAREEERHEGWAEGVGRMANEEVAARDLHDAVAVALADDAPVGEALEQKGRSIDDMTVDELQQVMDTLRKRAAKRAQMATPPADVPTPPTAAPEPEQAPDYGRSYTDLYTAISEETDAGELFKRRREVADARDGKTLTDEGYSALMRLLNARDAKSKKPAVSR